MKTKNTTLFICSHCDAQYQKWTGRCLECGKWGTIEEKAATVANKQAASAAPAAKTISFAEMSKEKIQRIPTGIGECDRVLGGGIVPGSLILLGGEPGIGKSTLSLDLATRLPRTLYISAEESVTQIQLRAQRLGLASKTLQLLNETHTETIIGTILELKPSLVIIDSIQTIASDAAEGSPGTPNQIRASTVALLETAKKINTSVIIVGHVTKEGTVAGPKTLEHLVDTVLYLEGERHHDMRILRAVKNRFGATDEVGIFEMQEEGLKEVANPSLLLLEERGANMPGSVVTCLMEGTRPMLVEVQALVNKTAFGYPQRKASGFDLNRLHVLAAVLERRAGLQLGQYDIHLNIVGGVRADEPGADLAVCIAIASAYKDKALGNDLAVFGEVGLGGEVRSIKFFEKRVKECEALGMKRVVSKVTKAGKSSKIQILNVKNIAELISKTW